MAANRRTRERTGDAETMANFKQFVKEMQKSRGRAVEMRLAILLSIGVGMKVFLSESVINSSAAHSVFFFMLGKLCYASLC